MQLILVLVLDLNILVLDLNIIVLNILVHHLLFLILLLLLLLVFLLILVLLLVLHLVLVLYLLVSFTTTTSRPSNPTTIPPPHPRPCPCPPPCPRQKHCLYIIFRNTSSHFTSFIKKSDIFYLRFLIFIVDWYPVQPQLLPTTAFNAWHAIIVRPCILHLFYFLHISSFSSSPLKQHVVYTRTANINSPPPPPMFLSTTLSLSSIHILFVQFRGKGATQGIIF